MPRASLIAALSTLGIALCSAQGAVAWPWSSDAPSADAGTKVIQEMPKAFWGEWATHPDNCGRDAEQSKKISAKKIQQYSSVIEVKGVTVTDGKDAFINGIMSWAEQGQKSTPLVLHYVLSADQRSFTLYEDTHKEVFLRCASRPTAKPAAAPTPDGDKGSPAWCDRMLKKFAWEVSGQDQNIVMNKCIGRSFGKLFGQ